MKILAIFLVILAFSSITISTKHLSSKLNLEDKLGENSTNGKISEAVTHGLGKSKDYVLLSAAGFKSPKMVKNLKPSKPKTTPDIVSNGNVFYDGSNNLAVLNVNCSLLSAKKSCVNNEKCGWCGDNKKCIPGTATGPLAPCLKNSYLYHTTSPNWDPLKAGTINIDAGNQIQVITKKVDMSHIHINTPHN